MFWYSKICLKERVHLSFATQRIVPLGRFFLSFVTQNCLDGKALFEYPQNMFSGNWSIKM